MYENPFKSRNWQANSLFSRNFCVNIPNRSEYIKSRDSYKNLGSHLDQSSPQATTIEIVKQQAVCVEFVIPIYTSTNLASTPPETIYVTVSEARNLANWILQNTEDLIDLE